MSNIPIVIINRDRFTTTVNLINQLLGMGYTNIHIADMDSSYPPLIEWYKTIDDQGSDIISVHHFPNGGQKYIWDSGWLKKEFPQIPWIAVSDSDIELDPRTPNNFIEQMIVVAKECNVDKVGLSIKFSDITNSVLKEIITPIESNYWKIRIQHPTHYVFSAPVDTTLCVVRPEQPFQYQGVRIADWSIKHCDWYSDWNNLTEEERYYFDNADERIATTKGHYLKYLATK